MENILTPAVLLDNMQTTLQDIMEYWKTNNGGWKDDLDFNVYKSDTYKEEKINEKDPNFNPIEYLIDNADELSKQIDVRTYATETRKDIVDKDGKHYKMKTSGLNGLVNKQIVSISALNFQLATIVKKSMLKTRMEDWKSLDRFKLLYNIGIIAKLIKLGDDKQDPSNPFDADWIFGRQVLEDSKKFLENCLS
jgi:hypothetical protein